MESQLKQLTDQEVINMSFADAKGYDWHLVPLSELYRLVGVLSGVKCIDGAMVKSVILNAIGQIEGGAKSL